VQFFNEVEVALIVNDVIFTYVSSL